MRAPLPRHGHSGYADRNREVLRDGWPLPDTICILDGMRTSAAADRLAAISFQGRAAIACHLHSLSAATLHSRTEN